MFLDKFSFLEQDRSKIFLVRVSNAFGCVYPSIGIQVRVLWRLFGHGGRYRGHRWGDRSGRDGMRNGGMGWCRKSCMNRCGNSVGWRGNGKRWSLMGVSCRESKVDYKRINGVVFNEAITHDHRAAGIYCSIHLKVKEYIIIWFK